MIEPLPALPGRPSGSSERLHRTALLLLAASGTFVSGEEIGRRLRMSRPAVGKHVQALRRLGYQVESTPGRGHRITGRPDRLLPMEVEDGLGTERLGRVVHHFESVESTQTVARQLAGAGAPEGTIVVAEAQVAGRGRLGRAYVSPPGGIWFSIVLRPRLPPTQLRLLALASGLAVAEAANEVCPVHAVLKWPNDVLLRGRKLCGVLMDMAAEHDVVHHLVLGIGINVNVAAEAFPADLRPLATSLQIETGQLVSRRLLLQRVLVHLETHYDQVCRGGSAGLVESWKAWPNVLSRRVQVTGLRDQYEGVAEDLAPDGTLLLRLDDGSLARVVAGDVHLRPVA
ncbi:MAG: biotin--[acetyl-CoA-carboxylase] ligase [Chloroflexota bacterium]